MSYCTLACANLNISSEPRRKGHYQSPRRELSSQALDQRDDHTSTIPISACAVEITESWYWPLIDNGEDRDDVLEAQRLAGLARRAQPRSWLNASVLVDMVSCRRSSLAEPLRRKWRMARGLAPEPAAPVID